MPVFWHFRVLFSLQTFLRPLIFDTLFRAEVKQVCNAISVTQLSKICSPADSAHIADNILHQAAKTVLNPSDFLQFFSIVNLLTILILTWQRMTLFWNLNTHISHKFEFVVFYAVKSARLLSDLLFSAMFSSSYRILTLYLPPQKKMSYEVHIRSCASASARGLQLSE